MKRLVFALAALLALSLPLAAQRLDAAVDLGLSGSSTDTSDFTVYGKLSPSFSLPIGTGAEFAGSGFVMGAYSTAYANDPSSPDGTAPLTYGLDQFRLETASKAPQAGIDALVFDLGRFRFQDPSGYVLSSPADGLAFAIRYPNLDLDFRSGYTGLLFEDDSTIFMSLADEANDGILGSPRLLAQAQIGLPNLLGESFALTVLSQSDLNPSSSFINSGSTVRDPSKGGRLNTQYFELESSGSISTVVYQAFLVYGTGTTLSWIATSATEGSYQYEPISSFFAGANASLPLPTLPIAGSTLGFELLYASGDTDGSLPLEGNTSSLSTAFTPVSTATLGEVFSPYLSNLIVGKADFGAKPSLFGLSFDGEFDLLTFFRPTLAPIYVTGVKLDPVSNYLGTEADLKISCGILSDIEVSCTIGVFIPQGQSIQGSGSVVASVKI